MVTGAFSYIGAAVAAELVRRGWSVRTLTNRRPPAVPNRIASTPLRFDRDYLLGELRGCDLFVNTYWIRIPWNGGSFEEAVANSKLLLDATRDAGVGRVVQVSVSNAASGTDLGYYRGKAEVESHLERSSLSFAIVRPTLVVGPADVLTNNIAWFLRRFPVFPMPGGGTCRLQPVTLADTARIVADAGTSTGSSAVDAAGPEVFTFDAFVRLVASACGVRRAIVPVPEALSLLALRALEPLLGDVVLTREELAGLRQELLLSREPPLGKESVSGWLRDHGAQLGVRYVNDLDRHFRSGASTPILDPAALG